MIISDHADRLLGQTQLQNKKPWPVVDGSAVVFSRVQTEAEEWNVALTQRLAMGR